MKNFQTSATRNSSSVDETDADGSWTSKPLVNNSAASSSSDRFLPIEIPIDRCFDVQWNPPGYPLLNASYLQAPWGDWGDRRDGFYTFQTFTNGTISFVRKAGDGEIVPVFQEVEFLAISDDVLLFNGDPHGGDGFPLGGGYGTLIKAPSIPAGDTDGSWTTKQLVNNSEMTAQEWLMKNFQTSATRNSSSVDKTKCQQHQSTTRTSLWQQPVWNMTFFFLLGFVCSTAFFVVKSKCYDKKRIIAFDNNHDDSSKNTYVGSDLDSVDSSSKVSI
eukprot:CAMPEP_0185724702 /NCGR_PEP_ID=MMETSP1171-20130828/1107_1 /TAXON_ID=374046 /ORGANISM="Helicotheca tamensis, Strain CCMP826" /LENGTH=273 /DNA_ID=CAMNT_0028392619 /DNA_START=1 /DNA_END=825 /DNA_ORIENTATION=-